MQEIGNILSQLDTQTLLFLNSFHTNFTDHIMWYVTTKWTWLPLYATILYVIIKRGNKYAIMISIAAFVLTIICTDQICASIIRPYIHRLRPSNALNPISSMLHLVNGYRGGTCGMPSCHAANSFGLAFFMMFYFRNRVLNFFMFSWAILNAYSRIYTGVHYPSDLFVGGIVGLGSAFLIYSILKWLNKKDYIPKDIVDYPWNTKSVSIIIYIGGTNILATIFYALFV